MRKAILEKFIFVLLAALCINSVIFYIASRNTILDTTKKDMLYTMEILDQTLDYEGDLAGQVQRMENFTPVFFPIREYIFGPIKIENSFTFTLKKRAAR